MRISHAYDGRLWPEVFETWVSRDCLIRGKRFVMRQGTEHNQIHEQYGDIELYNQLRFFSYLFNAEKAVKAAQGTTKHGRFSRFHSARTVIYHVIDEILSLTGLNHAFLCTMTDTVEKYLDRCGRRWVELSSLFSFMKM
jgi:DNA polymerase alpha subunit A